MDKIRTDLSVLSVSTVASITSDKRIPRKKNNIKSLTTSPPRNDPVQNQDKNTLGIEKYQSLPPHLPKFPPVFKSLRNDVENDYNESIYKSCTDKDDTPRTDKDDSIENLKSTNKRIVTTNTKKIIRNINTVMELLSKNQRRIIID